MSKRKDRERAESGIIYRSGVPVSASVWERQRQSAMADLEAAAKRGIKELQSAFAIVGHAIGMGLLSLPMTYLRELDKEARKHGGEQKK